MAVPHFLWGPVRVYNRLRIGLGCLMQRVRGLSLLLFLALSATVLVRAQNKPTPDPAAKSSKIVPNIQTQVQTPAPPIPADAPRMSKQTRFEIIRDFETQIVY